jgi:sugar phosphate isomerase/epimerase
MSEIAKKPAFGVDLITFYEPSFWGVRDRGALVERSEREPRWFWDRVLESVNAAGIGGIEVCFPPGTWQSAVAAYGSAKEFEEVLSGRGLQLISGFFDAFEILDDPLSASGQKEIIESAKAYARFLQEAGGDVLVSGMPVLDRETAGNTSFLDLDYAKAVADVINRVGDATRDEGARLALHTEMGSVFCTRRDIDLFMLLTDPEYVWMCPDTGHITLGGSNPIDVLDAHFERIIIAHWKDATGPFRTPIPPGENRHPYYSTYFRRVGAGAVDWFTWARRLRDMRYSGWTILELDEGHDPIGEMTAARDFVETALAGIRTP